MEDKKSRLGNNNLLLFLAIALIYALNIFLFCLLRQSYFQMDNILLLKDIKVQPEQNLTFYLINFIKSFVGEKEKYFLLLNIFLNGTNAIALFFLIKEWIENSRVAILGSLLFLLFPTNSIAVYSMTSTGDILCLGFAIWSIIFLRKSLENDFKFWFFAYWLISFILAFYSNQYAVFIKLIIIVFWINYFKKGFKLWDIYPLLSFLVISGFYILKFFQHLIVSSPLAQSKLQIPFFILAKNFILLSLPRISAMVITVFLSDIGILYLLPYGTWIMENLNLKMLLMLLSIIISLSLLLDYRRKIWLYLSLAWLILSQIFAGCLMEINWLNVYRIYYLSSIGFIGLLLIPVPLSALKKAKEEAVYSKKLQFFISKRNYLFYIYLLLLFVLVGFNKPLDWQIFDTLSAYEKINRREILNLLKEPYLRLKIEGRIYWIYEGLVMELDQNEEKIMDIKSISTIPNKELSIYSNELSKMALLKLAPDLYNIQKISCNLDNNNEEAEKIIYQKNFEISSFLFVNDHLNAICFNNIKDDLLAFRCFNKQIKKCLLSQFFGKVEKVIQTERKCIEKGQIFIKKMEYYIFENFLTAFSDIGFEGIYFKCPSSEELKEKPPGSLIWSKGEIGSFMKLQITFPDGAKTIGVFFMEGEEENACLLNLKIFRNEKLYEEQNLILDKNNLLQFLSVIKKPEKEKNGFFTYSEIARKNYEAITAPIDLNSSELVRVESCTFGDREYLCNHFKVKNHPVMREIWLLKDFPIDQWKYPGFPGLIKAKIFFPQYKVLSNYEVVDIGTVF